MIILLATTAVTSKDVSSMESKFVPPIRSKGMWSSNGYFRLLHRVEEGMVDDIGKRTHILKSGEYPTFAGFLYHRTVSYCIQPVAFRNRPTQHTRTMFKEQSRKSMHTENTQILKNYQVV